jgi:hypothetical protein
MEIVTGYDCYKAMTELEQRRWQRACRGNQTFLLNKNYHNFCDFIEASFSWNQTKQGVEYWATVCEKYKLHDQLNPSPRFKTKPPKTF